MAENCDYADVAVKSKNCYYSFGVFYCENVYYARYSRKCTDCNGITLCVGCQWCTECIDCVNGYNLSYCQNCTNCNDCSFCESCFGCKDCFGSVGLYQKQYCFFNEQLSKEEYEKRVALIDLKNPEVPQKVRQKIEHLKSTAPHLALQQVRTEDCIGNYLTDSKNCYQCFDGFSLEDCSYVVEANGNKDGLDLTVCFETELCYSCVQSPLNYNCNFLFHTDSSSDSEFCAYSKNLKNCFGCVYLKDKEYYILNEPYSAEKYAQKVQEIKAELVKNRQYTMSAYCISDYENQCLVSETDSVIQSQLPSYPFIPVSMISQQTLICKNVSCAKSFNIIAQEQRIYDMKKLPLPELCPACRHVQRMALRSQRKLYNRTCDKCSTSMLSTYPENAPYKIYCQKCFWENIG